VQQQGAAIAKEPGLQWDGPYVFLVAWFDIPSSPIIPNQVLSESAEWPEEGLLKLLVQASHGSLDHRGLKRSSAEMATSEALNQLYNLYL
jgi:hypothetical protein